MSKTPKDSSKGSGALSWGDKVKEASRQVREARTQEIQAALERGDEERAEELIEEGQKRSQERQEAKRAGRDLRAQIKAAMPTSNSRRWADNEIAKAVRSGRNAEGVAPRHPNTQWNMSPGQMVRLVNQAEAWTESHMIKMIPKGAYGILLDPPTGDRAAVMFGADVFTVACKKLRPVLDEDE